MATALPIVPQHVMHVATPEEFQAATTRYLVQGFTVVAQDATSVLLLKKKEFNIIFAIVGFFFCVLPLAVYVIYYLTQSDQIVRITLAPPAMSAWSTNPPPPGGSLAQPGLPMTPAQVISPDGKYYWDGRAWQPIED